MIEPRLQPALQSLLGALSAIRAPVISDEYDLHSEVAKALESRGMTYRHEAPVAPRCRIDFLVGRIGIEVKKARPASVQLRSQLLRYCQSEQLDAVIVVTQQSVPLPDSISGKPVLLLSLNRLWGIALP
ncbi:MAG: hypothetical protein U0L09_04245 [Christensenellales bacterium]|nr:hypothetical protein [Christensenellales bacterium]